MHDEHFSQKTQTLKHLLLLHPQNSTHTYLVPGDDALHKLNHTPGEHPVDHSRSLADECLLWDNLAEDSLVEDSLAADILAEQNPVEENHLVLGILLEEDLRQKVKNNYVQQITLFNSNNNSIKIKRILKYYSC